MLKAGFTSLITPLLHKVYFDEIARYKQEYPQLFNVLKSGSASETDQLIAGLPGLQVKNEGASIQYADFIEGGEKEYANVTYALGARYTQEMYEDDKYGVMKKATIQLARSARYSEEVIAFGILNNAFSTSYTGFLATTTAESLCDTSHDRLGTGVSAMANRPSSDCDLSLTALQAATVYFQNLTNERGMPIQMSPKFLVVAPLFRIKANELLRSSGQPESASNEINVLRDDDMVPFIGHHLTDADAWFVIGPKGEHDLNVYIRVPHGITAGDDFDTGDSKWKVRLRMAAGFGQWYGVYGSTGA